MKKLYKKLLTVSFLLLSSMVSKSQSAVWVELPDSNLLATNFGGLQQTATQFMAFDNANKLYRNAYTACFGSGIIKYFNNSWRPTNVSGCDNTFLSPFQTDGNNFVYTMFTNETMGGVNGTLYKLKGDSINFFNHNFSGPGITFNGLKSFTVSKTGAIFLHRLINNYLSAGWNGIYIWSESLNNWTHLRGTGSDTLVTNHRFSQLITDKYGSVIAGLMPTSSSLKYFKWNGTKWLEMGVNAGYYNTTNMISGIVKDVTGNLIGYGNLAANPTIPFRVKWNETNLVWDQIPYSTNSIYGDTCIKINTITYDASGNAFGVSKCKNIQNREFVALFNGISWVEIGNLSNNGNINAIAIDNFGNLYAGGDFTNASNQYYVAKLDAIMPSTITNFSLTRDVHLVNCAWKVSAEINVEAYHVQRSMDGINFETVGIIKASGSSHYFIKDNLSSLSKNTRRVYYRLLIIDKDASKNYSNTKSIDIKMNSIEYTIAPNPVKDMLTITTQGANELILLDCFGRVLLKNTISSNQPIKIATNQFTNGVYFIKLSTVSGESVVKQVVFN